MIISEKWKILANESVSFVVDISSDIKRILKTRTSELFYIRLQKQFGTNFGYIFEKAVMASFKFLQLSLLTIVVVSGCYCVSPKLCYLHSYRLYSTKNPEIAHI